MLRRYTFNFDKFKMTHIWTKLWGKGVALDASTKTESKDGKVWPLKIQMYKWKSARTIIWENFHVHVCVGNKITGGALIVQSHLLKKKRECFSQLSGIKSLIYLHVIFHTSVARHCGLHKINTKGKKTIITCQTVYQSVTMNTFYRFCGMISVRWRIRNTVRVWNFLFLGWRGWNRLLRRWWHLLHSSN